MFHTPKLLPILAILAVIGFAAPTKGDPIVVTFADRAVGRPVFDAAVANQTTITFEGAQCCTDTTQIIPASLTFQGVTFAVPAVRRPLGDPNPPGVEVINGFNVGAAGTNILTVGGTNNAGSFASVTGIDNVQITLALGMQTVGFDLKNGNTAAGGTLNGSYEIFVNGVLLGNANNLAYTTFGFVMITGLDPNIANVIGIRATAGGEPVIDNFSYSPDQAAIPEPTSMVLLGTGLIGVASAVRKRRVAKRNARSTESAGDVM